MSLWYDEKSMDLGDICIYQHKQRLYLQELYMYTSTVILIYCQ